MALVEGLLRILTTAVPDATILPIPSHWVVGLQDPACYVDNGRDFREPRVRFPRVVDQFEPTAEAWLRGAGGPDVHEYLDRFRAADLVLWNGEGSIYRANVSAVRGAFLSWFARVHLGVPTVFANGGVHLTDVDPVLPAMIRRTFPVLDAVAVREPRSLRNLQTFAPGLTARVVPDAAFALTPDDAVCSPAVEAVLDELGTPPFFCFDPGPMPFDHGRESAALERLITAIAAAGFEAVLVCKDPTDTYLRTVAAHTGARFVDTLQDFREYMALTDRAEFVVTGRYHNTIFSAIMGCPAVTFGSASHKVHGVCEMLGDVYGRTFDGTSLIPDLDAIVAQARGYADDRDGWRLRLRETTARRRAEAGGLGDLVRSCLGPGRAGSRDGRAAGT